MAGTRQRIITATNELFRRHGFNATSLKDVTVASGAPMGSVYHFFPGGKTELAAAAVRDAGASYGELFELIADAANDPASAVNDFFEGAATELEQSDYIDVCPIGSIAREVASSNETLRVATAEVLQGWAHTASSRFVSAGMDARSADSLAITVIAALEGGFVVARAHRDANLLRQVGDHIRHLVSITLAEPSHRPDRTESRRSAHRPASGRTRAN